MDKIHPTTYIDVRGADKRHKRSYSNPLEIRVVCTLLENLGRALSSSRTKPNTITVSVLSPLRAQVQALQTSITGLTLPSFLDIKCEVLSGPVAERHIAIVSAVRTRPIQSEWYGGLPRITEAKATYALFVVGHATILSSINLWPDIEADPAIHLQAAVLKEDAISIVTTHQPTDRPGDEAAAARIQSWNDMVAAQEEAMDTLQSKVKATAAAMAELAAATEMALKVGANPDAMYQALVDCQDPEWHELWWKMFLATVEYAAEA